MTLSHQQASLEKVTWSKVRKDVHKVNPELAAIIDDINPGEELPFYRAKYPFGVTIFDEEPRLPAPDGSIVAISDRKIVDTIREDLNYTSGLPIGLVLNHSIELSIKAEDGMMPWILMAAGRVFGLWRGIEPEPSTSYHSTTFGSVAVGMSSGFVLPSIADINAYKKLAKARGLKRNLPRSLQEHCAMLANISKHPSFSKDWQMHLLYFSSSWFENLKNYPHLIIYFQQYIIEKSAFWRNKIIFDSSVDSFIKNLDKENIVVKPYIIDIFKHLITIAIGQLPAFAPAIDDEIAPVTALQEDLLTIYGLRNFSSTIMVPTYFNMHEPKARPVYWSLQLPYYFESVPKPRTVGTLLEVLKQIHQLIHYFISASEQGKLSGIAGTPLETCIRRVKFTCFHSDIDSEGLIQHIHKMPKEDPTLYSFALPGHKIHQQGFSDTTPFARGCVRISLK